MRFIRNAIERRPFPDINRVQISASTFKDQRLERTDFAVVHDSPSIGAGPSIALYRKLEDSESSDKVLSWRAAIKRVIWQLISKVLCSLSVSVTRRSSNAIPGLVETCNFVHNTCISLHTGCLPWQKLMQKIAILTRTCRLTVAGLLFVSMVRRAGIRRAPYLCLDCAKNMDKNWNIIYYVTVSFIIHVNFDHAWAEY